MPIVVGVVVGVVVEDEVVLDVDSAVLEQMLMAVNVVGVVVRVAAVELCLLRRTFCAAVNLLY